MTALFLWISTAFNSCGTKADDILNDTSELASETIDDADDFFDDADDIFEDDGDDIFVDEVEDDSYADDSFDNSEEVIDTDYTEPTSTYSAPASTSTTKSYSSSGEYMVIAGNYLVESNARTMMKKLSNLGYPGAEIGVFDRSQYHTVIAQRSNSYSAAMELSNAIKRQGIDSYVKRKQY